MHCIMQNFKINAQVCKYFLADFNIEKIWMSKKQKMYYVLVKIWH